MRLDYRPADCERLHATVADELAPLAAQWLAVRQSQLGLDTVRPWDLEADPTGQPPLAPCQDADELADGVALILAELAPEFSALFARMRNGFLDLWARPGKMPGGEEWFFPVTQLPYIHLNAVGTAQDVLTLLHECGHAVHDWLSSTHQPLFWNLGGPSEFSEFAAITTVALALPLLERSGLFDAAGAARARQDYLESIFVRFVPTITMADAFQHWVYTTDPATLTPAALAAQWRSLAARFQPGVDWSGLEDAQGYGWQSMRLLFSQPFYAIEYTLAHLGALQVWEAAAADHSAALDRFMAALALGGTAPLPALFAAAGAALPFDPAVVRRVVAFVAPQVGAAR